MLVTKLHIPSTGVNLVHRSILFDKLNEGLKRKLILISAPAGFGKTTLIGDWINIHKIPTAWFSIDTGDNDPVEFLSYIISAIQSLKKETGQNTLKLLESPNPPEPESIINLLINDVIKINQDFLLVLDDFQLISNRAILELVTYLLDHIPANIHVVISTRSDPNLHIAKLRSQHQMVELRSSDLSFSAKDISVLFNKKLKIKLSVDDIYSLESKTEGWIAGLQLAALSLQGYEDKSVFIEAFAGNNRYIMDYLIEEVLKIQTDDIKEFLLHTSILKQISAPLCNTVLNRQDSQIVLEKLEKNNMFVFPLDNERNWYRYHHLFADLLNQNLLLKDKFILEELHNKACDWFVQNKMFESAIEHALEINNYNRSIQLLGDIVEHMWESGKHAAIMKYGDLLPDELIKKNPDFCLYYSWILIMAGQIQKAEPFLASAEKLTNRIISNTKSSDEEVKYYKKLKGKIAVAFAYLNSHEEHSEKIFDSCKIAMENLSEDDPLWFSWAWFSYGVAHFSIGDLHESNKAYIKALAYGKKSNNIYLITTIVIRLAEIEQQLGHYKSAYKRCTNLLKYLNDRGYSHLTKADWTYAALYFVMAVSQFTWAEMDKALESVKIAYNLCKGGKDIYLKIFILLFYSFLLNLYGDTESEKKINELEDLMKQNTIPPFLTFMYVGWKIYISINKNQIDKAYQVISEYGLNVNEEITHTNEAAYIAYIRLLIFENKLSDAEIVLSKVFDMATKGKHIERLIEIKIAYATLYKLRGKQKEAITNLIEAMEFAAEEDLISYFLFNVDFILDLLKEAYKIQATQVTKIPDAFIKKLQIAVEKSKAIEKTQLEIDISSRELDTLKLIAEEITNQEIADKLFISLNTVKTHVRNILLKLEVENRNQAVSKAKELGII